MLYFRRQENTKPISALLVVVIVVSLVTGCAGNVPKQTPFMKSIDGVTITSVNLKQLIYEYVRVFAARLEFAADQIIEETGTPYIRRQALLWKIYGLSVMQAAAFQPDPMAALVDCWVFAVQMEQYYTSGKGRDIFGPHQHIAIEMSQEAVEIVKNIALLTTKSGVMPGNNAVAKIDSFATIKPIENQYFVRESIRPYLIEFTAGEIKSGLGGVGQLNESVSDLSERMAIYVELLPKETRWQADLVITERVGDPAIPRLLEDIDAIQSRIAAIDVSAREIAESMDGIPIELTDEQMDEIVNLVNAEIEKALLAVERERIAIFAAVERERAVILAEVEALTTNTLDQTKQTANELVQSLYVKAIILLALLLVGVLVIGLVFIGLTRKRRIAEGLAD